MSQLNNLMFPVKEVPAICNQPLNNEEVIPSGYKFIVREDTNKVLSCMTDDYKLVTNETVIKYANPIIKKNGGKVKEVKSLNNGAKSIMTWNFPKEKVNIGKGDDLTPEIIIKNSYDGTVGLNILAGAFRLICSNGAIIGIVAEDYKNKHSVYNIALNDIESVIKQTIEKTKIIFKDEFPILKDNKISERDIVNFLKLFPLQANETITQRLIADKPKTYWDLFNVGTNVLTHNMNRNTESTHNIESSLYNTVKKWALASA
jgi:hypothetical protein